MTQQQVLEEANVSLKELKKKVTDEFYYQDEATLNHKPAPEKWSATQCFEHINLTNRYYIDLMFKSLKEKDLGAWNRSYRSGLFGGYMIKSMRPKNGKVTNPMKTFKNVRPLVEREGKDLIVKPQKVFTDFFKDVEDFEKLLDQYKEYDINKIKITSLVGPVLKFKVGDCFPFLFAHTNRHIVQALNAMGSGYDTEK